MRLGWRTGIGVVLSLALVTGSAAPAGASLLGGLVGGLIGTTTGLVGGVLGIVTAGWDDGATTAPTPMSDVVKAVGADRAWGRGYDGSGVTVAVIDSGVAAVDGLTASGKVVNGPDLSFESQSDAYRYLDTFGHGTHMAGIIAGRDVGTQGSFKGVAPGARIVSLKVATREGAADVSQVIAAIDWVVQHRNDPGLNIRVLNLSYGTDGTQDYLDDPLAMAVESAWRNGIVVVAAGGNDGTQRSSLVNPATDPYVLAVGAVDLAGTVSAGDDQVAPFSSRGSLTRGVDVVAPGVSIASLRDPGSAIDDAHPSAVVDGRFFRGSGTSQAAAVASGAAAVLLDARPDLTPDQVKALLENTATPLASTDLQGQGAGRINVDLATRSLVPSISAVRQVWPQATGTGSLEGARGTNHLAEDGIDLAGEEDVMGMPWNGVAWAPRSASGTAWSGGSWNGADWTSTCFCSTSWSGSAWTGKTWTGKTWTGKTWTTGEWAGKTWTGKTWTGKTWTGKTWTGKTWTGKTWTTPMASSAR
jgi:serine protease AprX